MPRTRLGTWAGWLLIVALVLLTTLIIGYNTDVLGGWFGQGTPSGVALWVAAAIASLATLITGVISWLRLKDRSAVVIVATIYGLLASILLGFGAMPQV
jgi:hypothetical protein